MHLAQSSANREALVSQMVRYAVLTLLALPHMAIAVGETGSEPQASTSGEVATVEGDDASPPSLLPRSAFDLPLDPVEPEEVYTDLPQLLGVEMERSIFLEMPPNSYEPLGDGLRLLPLSEQVGKYFAQGFRTEGKLDPVFVEGEVFNDVVPSEDGDCRIFSFYISGVR